MTPLLLGFVIAALSLAISLLAHSGMEEDMDEAALRMQQLLSMPHDLRLLCSPRFITMDKYPPQTPLKD